jgi:pentatricopeptide repeat protein
MQEQGIEPDSFIFSSVVKVCADLSVLQEGIDVYDDIARLGLELDIVVSTTLVTMYAKCGVLELAREVFDKMSERNVVTWSAMIAGYAQKGYAGEALKIFNGMRVRGFEPDLVIMVSVLPAFSSLSDLQDGKCIHGYLIRSEFESDFSSSTALIDMYAKCGSVGFAR